MQEYFRFRDRIIKITSVCIIAAAIVCLVLNKQDVGLGVLLGGIFSVIKFFYLSQTIVMLEGQSISGGKRLLWQRGMIRYGLSALCLVIAIAFAGHVNFWAAVAGLFSIMAVIMADQFSLGVLTGGNGQ